MFDTGCSRQSAFAQHETALRPTWRVHVIHRETGALLRLGGMPLTLLGKDRATMENAALDGRDPDMWQAVATPLIQPFAEV